MLPSLVGLFLWWGTEISKLFCKKCQCKETEDKPIKQEIISKQDIERFITAAVIMGIQKFASTHPKTQDVFNNIIDVIKNVKTENKT